MSENREQEWFKEWFNSEYYGLLYQHRDEKEADDFIRRLVGYLQLPPSARVLDLACGDGRHCRVFEQLGFNVFGIDLAEDSISTAKRLGNKESHYMVADMRTFELDKSFHLITNLFTSFGYFQRGEENKRVLQRIHAHLQPKGLFVLDFLNLGYVEANIVHNEVVRRGDIYFQIRRKIEGGQILKNIQFDDNDRHFDYTEQVQALSGAEIKRMLEDCQFDILTTFGDYFLNPFDADNSSRFIVICQRHE